MTYDEATQLIISSIKTILDEREIYVEVTPDMVLLGGESTLDSMMLVELCVALEDKATLHNFEFDWTSDTAMSKSRSMFRSAQTLAEEFYNQYQAQQ